MTVEDWVCWQTRGAGDTLDSRLASGSGVSKAHAVGFVLGDNWNHKRQRALCGATVPAGDDLDVVAFHGGREANRCQRCVRKATNPASSGDE